MTTKAINKDAKTPHSAVVRGAASCKAASTPDQPATTAIAGKREAFGERRAVVGRGTKNAHLLQLLNRPEGASIEDMMQATEWQQHSVRGFLAGTVKKKMGLSLTSSRAEGEVRRYRIVSRRGR